MWSTRIEVSISEKLQAFVNNPNDAGLAASIRSDMAALRGLRDKWNTLPSERLSDGEVLGKNGKAYNLAMQTINNLELRLTQQRLR